MSFRKIVYTIALLFCWCGSLYAQQSAKVLLPEPAIFGNKSLEQVLHERRSVRGYTNDPIALNELSQLLWAAQGITSTEGFRTAPSAGALYPLEVYAVVKRVAGLEKGVYHYIPSSMTNEHSLEQISADDPSAQLDLSVVNSHSTDQCAVAIVIVVVIARTEVKYGDRAGKYTLLEAGHAAQNALLQATSLGLGAVPIGAIHIDEAQKLVKTKDEPVYLLSIGKTK